MQIITAHRKRAKKMQDDYLRLLELHQQLLEAKSRLIPRARWQDPTALTGVAEKTHSVAQLLEQISTLKAGQILGNLARKDGGEEAMDEPGAVDGLAAEPEARKTETTIPPPKEKGEPLQEV